MSENKSFFVLFFIAKKPLIYTRIRLANILMDRDLICYFICLWSDETKVELFDNNDLH